MEVRPIDANALINQINDTDEFDGTGIKYWVNQEPTLDYEPVVHACWIVDDSFYSGAKKAYYCSNCNYLAYQDIDVELHKRCPDCGAKMDEEDE